MKRILKILAVGVLLFGKFSCAPEDSSIIQTYGQEVEVIDASDLDDFEQ